MVDCMIMRHNILFATTILQTSSDENKGDFTLESEYCTSQHVQNLYTNLASLLITSSSSMVLHNDAMNYLQIAPYFNTKYPSI